MESNVSKLESTLKQLLSLTEDGPPREELAVELVSDLKAGCVAPNTPDDMRTFIIPCLISQAAIALQSQLIATNTWYLGLMTSKVFNASTGLLGFLRKVKQQDVRIATSAKGALTNVYHVGCSRRAKSSSQRLAKLDSTHCC
eukprot:m.10116 g.10116  ORF g.10116 m.10116 type:complete len:142 (-) comp9583_c0_seq1:103-528(-)